MKCDLSKHHEVLNYIWSLNVLRLTVNMLAMFANVVYSVNKCLLDYHLKEYLICTCLFPF